MKLREVVCQKAIIPELRSESRDDAIAELVDALVEHGALEPDQRDEYLAAIIKREERGSTGFGHGVAVPHVKHADIDTMVAAVGISPGGVDFNALDQQPVHTVFLLLTPEDRPEDHLDAMNLIFGNLQDPTFRRFLRQASTIDDVMTLLDEADARAAAR